MDFGEAIKRIRNGQKMRRRGWNGRGMHVYLETCATTPMECGGQVFEPALVMLTAQGRHQIGWLASQADLLGDDWECLGPV
jgi:hypothetical protein